MVAVQVGQVIGLEAGERVGAGGQELQRAHVHRRAALPQYDLGQVEAQQRDRPSDVEEDLGRPGLGEGQHSGALVLGRYGRQPAGEPQLGADRSPQGDRRVVGDHDESGEVGAGSGGDGTDQVAIGRDGDEDLVGCGDGVGQHPAALETGGADGGTTTVGDGARPVGRCRVTVADDGGLRSGNRTARAGRHDTLLRMVRAA
jgi:hypothetical protein